MEPLSWLFLFGLEIHRFAPVDDGADGLGSSLDAVETGGHHLGSYEGPALQPYIAFERGRLGLVFAPAMAGRIERLESADGREGTLFVRQWLVETRIRYGRSVFGELDLSASNGSASLDGVRVADGSGYFGLGPSLGLRANVGTRLSLTGRARYTWRLGQDSQADSLGGALAAEWSFRKHE